MTEKKKGNDPGPFISFRGDKFSRRTHQLGAVSGRVATAFADIGARTGRNFPRIPSRFEVRRDLVPKLMVLSVRADAAEWNIDWICLLQTEHYRPSRPLPGSIYAPMLPWDARVSRCNSDFVGRSRLSFGGTDGVAARVIVKLSSLAFGELINFG